MNVHKAPKAGQTQARMQGTEVSQVLCRPLASYISYPTVSMIFGLQVHALHKNMIRSEQPKQLPLSVGSVGTWSPQLP